MSQKQPVPTGLQLTALDPVFRERPNEYLDRLRAEDPIHRDAELERLFLTRFEDAKAVVSNRSLSVDPRKAPDTALRRAIIGNVPPGAFGPSMLRLSDRRAASCFRRNSRSLARSVASHLAECKENSRPSRRTVKSP